MLKGGQKKLDMNKNGVLDGGDFKILGSKNKKMKGGPHEAVHGKDKNKPVYRGMLPEVTVTAKKTNKKTKKMYGGTAKKQKMTGGQQDVPAASFLEPPMPQPFAQQQMMQDPNSFTAKAGGVKRKKNVELEKALKKAKPRPKYKKGGAKLDYLDMDGDGNKKESMKSAISSKKKMMGGGMKKMMYGKGGNMKKMYKEGGVRELRKKQREERREDRKNDREAIRTLKKTSKESRKNMTKEERRIDRAATRRAARTFRKQERKSRRRDRREDRQERRDLRTSIRQKRKNATESSTTKKLETLNKSQSSSNVTKVPTIKTKTLPTKKVEMPTKKAEIVEKKKVTNHGVTDSMSFSKAFRTARNSHGGKGGVFTWKGKKYGTALKTEVKKPEEKKVVKVETPKEKKKENIVTTPKKKEETSNKKTTNYYRGAPVGYEVLRGPKYKGGGYRRRGGKR